MVGTELEFGLCMFELNCERRRHVVLYWILFKIYLINYGDFSRWCDLSVKRKRKTNCHRHLLISPTTNVIVALINWHNQLLIFRLSLKFPRDHSISDPILAGCGIVVNLLQSGENLKILKRQPWKTISKIGKHYHVPPP